MEGWAIPETITTGTIVFFALLIIGKFIGQRTDPKLLEVFGVLTKSMSERDEAYNDNLERLSNALDRNTKVLDGVPDGMRIVFDAMAQSIIKSFTDLIETNTTTHEEQTKSIHHLISQVETQQGNVRKMNDTVDTQSEAIQKILETVTRLEQRINEISDDVKMFKAKGEELSASVSNAHTQIKTVKNDVENLIKTKSTQETEKAKPESKERETKT